MCVITFNQSFHNLKLWRKCPTKHNFDHLWWLPNLSEKKYIKVDHHHLLSSSSPALHGLLVRQSIGYFYTFSMRNSWYDTNWALVSLQKKHNTIMMNNQHFAKECVEHMECAHHMGRVMWLMHCVIQFLFTVARTTLVTKYGAPFLHRPDDGGSKNLWNVGKLLPDYTALQPRRQPPLYSSSWEPQILNRPILTTCFLSVNLVCRSFFGFRFRVWTLKVIIRRYSWISAWRECYWRPNHPDAF
jgi:hypothetical protein